MESLQSGQFQEMLETDRVGRDIMLGATTRLLLALEQPQRSLPVKMIGRPFVFFYDTSVLPPK
jgi:hypothetical protein